MEEPKHQQQTNQLVEHFFRHQYGKIATKLIYQFGTIHFEAIEDAVQESLLKALKQWPFSGLPDNPEAWVLTVARNQLIDHLRKKNKMPVYDILAITNSNENEYSSSKDEELLRMMIACCHPKISKEYQLVLVLKILCGFSTPEVARALIKSEDAITKAYTRGKSAFKQHIINFDLPDNHFSNERINGVLKIIYLIFNEGYHSLQHETLIRRELCNEAIRLAHLLLLQKIVNSAKTHALLSLMYFHLSRIDVRIEENTLVTLENQDRLKWNRNFIEKGNYHLQTATTFGKMNEYVLQAGIAGYHANAPAFSITNWTAISGLYQLLVENYPGFVYKLNRVVALYYSHGIAVAKEELVKLKSIKGIDKYKLFHSVSGFIYEKAGNYDIAVDYYKSACELTTNPLEVNHYKGIITSLSISNSLT